MPSKKKSMDLRQSGDSRQMSSAIAWCSAQGLPVRRVSMYQLKVGPWNLYPDRGSFNRDDLPKKQTGGFPAFQTAVRDWWDRENAPYLESL